MAEPLTLDQIRRMGPAQNLWELRQEMQGLRGGQAMAREPYSPPVDARVQPGAQPNLVQLLAQLWQGQGNHDVMMRQEIAKRRMMGSFNPDDPNQPPGTTGQSSYTRVPNAYRGPLQQPGLPDQSPTVYQDYQRGT